MLVFCYMYIRIFCILYYHSHGWLHLETIVSTFSKWLPERLCVQYYNMASSWALQGPYCVHPRHPVLHFERVKFPGHVVTNDETSSPPLCRSCSLIPDMHLPNYYETWWINLLDVESASSKYQPVMTSVHLSGWHHFCMLRL